MRKFTSLSIAANVAAVVAAAVFWQKFHQERQTTVQLNERLARMELVLARQTAVAGNGTGPVQSTSGLPTGRANESAGIAVAREELIATLNAARPGIADRPDMKELMKDPEYRKTRLAQLLAEVSRKNSELARELGLTPEQAKSLFELLARQQLDAGMSWSSTDSSEVKQKVMSDLARKQQAALEAALGPAGYQRYREYQQTMPARQQVEQWRTTLAAANIPLTDAQRRSLVASLANEQQQRQAALVQSSGQTPGEPRPGQGITPQSLESVAERNGRMLEIAQSHLDPRQAAELRGALDQQLSLAQAVLRAKRAQRDVRSP